MSKFLKATIWITISEIIFNLSGFVIHAFVGRILGPDDYGRYGIIITMTTMIIILIGNGIPTAMSKYISEIFDTNPPLVRKIKHQAIIIQSILIGSITVIFYFSAPLFGKILRDPALTDLFRLSTFIIPFFASASFYFSYFTGLHKFNIQSFLKISRSVFRIIFIISLAYLFGIKGSILGYIAVPAMVFIMGYFIDRLIVSKNLRDIEMKIPNKLPRNPHFEWKKLVNYAWQIVIFFLAYELLISIDLYLVQSILRNENQTGIYNASLTIGRLPYYLFYSLTVVLFPIISKSTSEKNAKKTSGIISQSLRMMIILLTPIIILMSVYSEQVIRIFYGKRFLAAGDPMSILVFGVGFLTVFYVFCFIMSGAGLVKKPMVISILGLAINILLNYVLIIRYGLKGSAYATSITSAIIAFIMLFFVWKDFGVAIKLKSFMKILLAGIVTWIFSAFLPKGDYVFILWSIILFTIYISLLYALKEISQDDVEYIKKSLRRKKLPEIKEEFSGNEPTA